MLVSKKNFEDFTEAAGYSFRYSVIPLFRKSPVISVNVP
jgi:hypothetical protein